MKLQKNFRINMSRSSIVERIVKKIATTKEQAGIPKHRRFLVTSICYTPEECVVEAPEFIDALSPEEVVEITLQKARTMSRTIRATYAGKDGPSDAEELCPDPLVWKTDPTDLTDPEVATVCFEVDSAENKFTHPDVFQDYWNRYKWVIHEVDVDV